MPTEDRIRTLLARAAETIDIAPAPITHPPRRRWPAAVAVAATVALVAGAAAGGVGLVRRHTDPADTASSTASRDPSDPGTYPAADLSTADRSFRLGPDQVPSVAGLTAVRAQALLERHGYRVSVSERSSCPTAEDTYVIPAPGTIVPPGSTVTLHTTVIPPNVSCAQTDAADPRVLAFLAWARGLGPTPRFAPRVGVQFNGVGHVSGRSLVLRGAAVADRSQWPGLESLADVLAAPVRGESGLIPLLSTGFSSDCAPVPGGTCPQEPGAHLGGSADATSAKADTAALFDVMLEIDRQDLITAVVLVDHRTPWSGRGPDIVGDSAAYATARLRAYGLSVTTVATHSCAQRGQVVGATASGSNGVIIRVSRDDASCAT